MSTITTRAGKGSELTHTEVDANFTNLNTDKYESGSNAALGTLSTTGAVTLNSGNAAVNLQVNGDNGIAALFNGANNDIDFYDSTGVTASFHWDATDKRLGIGTTTPDGPIEVSDDSTYSMTLSTTGDLLVRSTAGGDLLQLIDDGAASENDANMFIEFLYSTTGLKTAATRLGYFGYSATTNNNISLVNETTTGEINFLNNNAETLSLAVTETIFNGANNDVNMLINGNNGVAVYIDGGTNDFYLYDDLGTTQKVRWNAAQEYLGLGTASPSYHLDITTTTNNGMRITSSSPLIRMQDADDGAYHTLIGSSDDWFLTADAGNTGAGNMIFRNGGSTERLRINASGHIVKAGSAGPLWASGTGSPESVVSAPVGSFYSRTDGGTGTSFYVKESGTGNTGWVAK